MKLKPTLQGAAPALDVSGILQLLESQRLSGTFILGQHWLRLLGGVVVNASADPVATVAALTSGRGPFEFRAVVGQPNGSLRCSLTALLLDAARLTDERERQTSDALAQAEAQHEQFLRSRGWSQEEYAEHVASALPAHNVLTEAGVCGC